MQQRIIVKMSELLDSVRRSFYNNILSFSDAEARLEGKEGRVRSSLGCSSSLLSKTVLCPTFSLLEKMESTSDRV